MQETNTDHFHLYLEHQIIVLISLIITIIIYSRCNIATFQFDGTDTFSTLFTNKCVWMGSIWLIFCNTGHHNNGSLIFEIIDLEEKGQTLCKTIGLISVGWPKRVKDLTQLY